MDVLMRVAQRLLQIVPTVALVAVLMFVLMRLLPGDPAIQLLGDRATDANIARLRQELGFDPIGGRAVLDLSGACRHAAPWRFHHAACAGDAAHYRADPHHADADGDGGNAGAADRGSAGLHCGAARGGRRHHDPHGRTGGTVHAGVLSRADPADHAGGRTGLVPRWAASAAASSRTYTT